MECQAALDEVVPELLVISSELNPAALANRIERDRFFPVVITLRGPVQSGIGSRLGDDLPQSADADTIRRSLNQAVRDIYDREVQQLLYLVDRYVAGLEAFPAYESVIKVERDGQVIDLLTDKIMSIVAARKWVSIHTASGKFMLPQPIHLIATKLNPQIFVRIHRSVIINCHYIDRTVPISNKSSSVVLIDGSRYLVGPTYRDALTNIANRA
jgi:DNA-binding LytR/AlgR family response regulator